MAGIGKMIIGAIITSVLVVFLSKVAALFPFYMTIVVETFNLANIAAADNYVKEPYYEETLDSLKKKPLFNQKPDSIKIEILNADGEKALGNANEYYYIDKDLKPYKQQGNPVKIIISAKYPFEFKLWGRTLDFDVPVSFNITAIGLKYYKDLELADPYNVGDIDDISYYEDTSY